MSEPIILKFESQGLGKLTKKIKKATKYAEKLQKLMKKIKQ